MKECQLSTLLRRTPALPGFRVYGDQKKWFLARSGGGTAKRASTRGKSNLNAFKWSHAGCLNPAATPRTAKAAGL
jgi:hypothetical protein